MSELVERAARAAYEKFNDGLIGSLEPTWDNCEQSFKERMMDAQRAAIEAMREPTEAMLEAAAPFPTHLNYEVVDRNRMEAATKADQLAIRSHWRFMIDEALK